MESIFRVGAESNPRMIAELIVADLQNDQQVILQAIGVKAVYQAVKASASAHRTLQPEQVVLLVAEFVDVEIESQIRTAIRFVLSVQPAQFSDLST